MSEVEINKIHEEDLIINQAITILKKRLSRENLYLTSPQAVKDFCFLKLVQKEHEVFSIIYLDNQHCMLDYDEVFRGSIASCSVYPREVVKDCLYKNVSAVIFLHNHSSGSLQPSDADKVITKRLQDALLLIDVRVLDHLIISRTGSFSFAEAGLI